MNDMPDWVSMLVYGPDDQYERYTSAFALKHQLDSSDVDEQLDVIHEELDEMKESLEHWREQERDSASPSLEEEIVDLLHATFVLGQAVNADIPTAFEEKARYNLEKSGVRNEDGKIIDDVHENE